MPDYNVSSGTQVEVTIYGKTLNDSYMHILYEKVLTKVQVILKTRGLMTSIIKT